MNQSILQYFRNAIKLGRQDDNSGHLARLSLVILPPWYNRHNDGAGPRVRQFTSSMKNGNDYSNILFQSLCIEQQVEGEFISQTSGLLHRKTRSSCSQ